MREMSQEEIASDLFDECARQRGRIAELESENDRLRYDLETIRRELTALADKAARARDNAADQ